MISPVLKRLFGMVLIALVLAACAPQTVRLEYGFPPGYHGRFHWSIRATTWTESPTEQTRVRMEARVLVDEHIRQEGPGSTTLVVRLKPQSVTEDGRPGAVPSPSTTEYQVDRRGRILRLVRANLLAGSVSSLELDTLATQTRPALSPHEVGLGDSWPAPLKIKAEKTSIDLKGTGRLQGFDLRDRRRLARVEIDRNGSITSQQMFNNSTVVLQGQSAGRGIASVDVDDGSLFSSTFHSTSRFNVILAGRRAARLRVVLSSRLQLIPSGHGL